MKRTHFYFITSILLALFTFAIFSCSDDDKRKIEVVNMIVEIDSESNLFHDLTGSWKPMCCIIFTNQTNQ